MTQAAEKDLSTLTAGLDVLEPIVPLLVKTRKASFDVSPVKMVKFKQFATLAWPLVEDVMALIDGTGNGPAFIEKHETALIDMLALSSEFTADHYAEMYPDEFLKLVIGMVEVNMDFFARNLIPMLGSRAQGIKEKIEASIKKLGLKASNA